jgi:hypothetical protein
MVSSSKFQNGAEVRRQHHTPTARKRKGALVRARVSLVPKSHFFYLQLRALARMAIPSRLPNERPGTFFVSAKTAEGRRLLQSERMASLLVEIMLAWI